MRLLVTGASGQLGGYLLRELAGRDHEVVAWSGSHTGELFGFPLQPIDLADTFGVVAAFRAVRPAVVLHAGALASVAACFRDPPRADRVNARGTEVLAELAGQDGARLLLVSTDLVFDGEHAPYREGDRPAPLSVYGRSKAAAEAAVRALPRGVVARVSLLYGPTIVGRPSFFDLQAAALREGQPVTLFEDEWRTPLDYRTAARALLGIVHSDFLGVLHVGGPERMSRVEMGRRLAVHLGADPGSIVAASRNDTAVEPRPRDTSLDSSLWRQLFPEHPRPGYEEALRELGI